MEVIKSRNKREGKWIPYGRSTIYVRNSTSNAEWWGHYPRHGAAAVVVL